MTLVILGFTEAASRRQERRTLYTIAAVLITLLPLAEVGWSARGSLSCAGDDQCLLSTQKGQLYFYIAWAVADSAVTGGFILLLYNSLATMQRARWHIMALCGRSLAIVVLAAVGLAHETSLAREAQVDVAMAASVCFLVVRAFRSLVTSVKATSDVYPLDKATTAGIRASGRTEESRLILRHRHSSVSTSSTRERAQTTLTATLSWTPSMRDPD